ncbi:MULTISPECIES: FUSC family protein [Citricoccus]|uniref:FUSC family protein n=1 Tax=Citricoccus TaxID=169133 RepID=UPI000255EFC3|nr:FUSC family protein [Citricoccus sp. CH26A]
MRMSDLNPVPSLFTIAPANKDHEVGIRCGITVLVPLLALLLMDRIDLAIFASFGAFTGIYGRNTTHGVRLHMQMRAGLLMVAVILAATLAGRSGVSESESPWALVGLTTVVAGLCTVVAGYWRLRPAGSLFHIFAFAAVASVPYQPPLGEAMLTAAAVVAWAVVVGLGSRVLPSRRQPITWTPRDRSTSDEHRIIWLEALWYAIAAGTAGSLATALGPALGIEHNYWAMVAAVVPLAGHSTRYRVNRGLQRVIGTFLGLILMAGILWLRPEPWLMILIIALFQTLAELYIARQYVLAQVVVTPLALLSTVLVTVGTGSPVDGPALLRDRFIETVIGAAVGVACVLYPWAWRKWVRRDADPATEARD